MEVPCACKEILVNRGVACVVGIQNQTSVAEEASAVGVDGKRGETIASDEEAASLDGRIVISQEQIIVVILRSSLITYEPDIYMDSFACRLTLDY